MPIASGTRFGPYEIISSAGAGGMGEVYRAKDTRLDRIVAVKVLPSQLAHDPEKRQRFEREARSISTLSHPHICTLHDIGHQDGVDYLVLEYLEGETLEKKLEKGSLPVQEVLKYAIELADALDKAHRQGVVHRDIKPGNIMLTKSGVKLMDFGLAKIKCEPVPATDAVTEMTSDKKLTAEGTILGTFQYMAPEQLEGRDTDARTDIFAFGQVLYEMATGRPAFSGKTRASLIAAILSSDPKPVTELAPMSPPALDHIAKTCLAKDPDDRWQTVHDVKQQLKWIAEAGSQAGLPAPIVMRRKWREGLALGIAAVALFVPISFAIGHFFAAPVEVSSIRSSVLPPEKSAFYFIGNSGGPVAVSPDGRRLAFVAMNADGKRLLWVRSLDALTALPLSGTDGAVFPFWSPDSRFIGFFSDGKLKKIEASGGPTQALSEAPQGRGGTMNADGVILFAPDVRSPIYSVSAAGGPATPVTGFETDPLGKTHRWPYFLPDGRHFLYLALRPGGENEGSGIYVASLDSKMNRFLVRASSNVAYVLGYLLFLRDKTLMAQPFDAKRLQLNGDPFPVAEQVQYDSLLWRGVFSVSQNGILAYQGGGISRAGTQLLWLDRAGKPIGAIGELEFYFTQRLSPDGQKLAVQIADPKMQNSDIWIYELSGGIRNRFTFDSSADANDANPVWSPDGSRIVFASNRQGHFDLYQMASSGGAREEVLLNSNDDKHPTSWSPDGRFIAYDSYSQRDQKRGKRGDIWVLPLFGDRKPFAFLQTDFEENSAQFSPDGRWIAYSSDESGKYEIYVAPFPGPGGKWQVSASGGLFPVWRPDGTELFYVALDNTTFMAAEVRTKGSTFEVRAVRPLFQRQVRTLGGNAYDVSSDGLRFLVNSIPPAEQNPAPITLVTNWTASLRH
jgi:eukaryotic-like serine/threonine-protein kinase